MFTRSQATAEARQRMPGRADHPRPHAGVLGVPRGQVLALPFLQKPHSPSCSPSPLQKEAAGWALSRYGRQGGGACSVDSLNPTAPWLPWAVQSQL